MCLLNLFVLLAIFVLGNGAPTEDLVVDLPGLNFDVNYNQYSGYLNGTEGRHLHYWFTESQNDPTTDPLVLWLNGGPGCSSVSGLLTENGPFFVTEDGSELVENPYSWNLIANVIFLESPACVGFSYDDNSTCRTGDEEVAEMNYLALQHFFAKFPEYRERDFFVTGESYAGIYIPTLSANIVEGNEDFPINFQGFAIGNGLLSYVSNENSLYFFGYYHALLGDELWGHMVSQCCDGVESRETCDFFLDISALCEVYVLEAEDILYYRGLNMYNLYGDCLHANSSEENRYIYDVLNTMFGKKHSPEVYKDPICTDSSSERAYLNTPEVRDALHIPSFVQDWDICSSQVSNRYVRTVYNVAPQLTYLHNNSIRGLIYNGDVDMAVNFLGNQWDVENLEYQVLEDRVQWRVNNDIAGYVKRFELLDFVTVRGSGHMVPTDKPAEALHMITAFINNEPYSKIKPFP